MSKIGIFDIQFSEEERKKFYSFCDQIFEEAYLTNHTFVKRFESEFAKFSKIDSTLLVPSGTSALELALKTIDVKGKKVILPTNTFIATAVAVLNAGAEPIILDIEDEYYGLSPIQLKNNIEEEVAAVITVHVGGHISPRIHEIVKICEENQIPLIEDCAHAHGSQLGGLPAGSFGIAGCFSHFLTKVMTTGEGGSLVTKNSDFFKKANSLRRFGFDPDNPLIHNTPGGGNYKVSEFQAALGVIELERIESRINKRRELALRYKENLKGTEWKTISDSIDTKGSFYKQIILPPESLSRKKIEAELSKAQIPLTGGVYNHPLHTQPIMKEYVVGQSFPKADDFCSRHICPPCYPELETSKIDLICEVLKKI